MLYWSFSRWKEEKGFSFNIEPVVFCMVALEHFSCTSIFCIVRNFLISTLELGADVPTREDESGELWRKISCRSLFLLLLITLHFIKYFVKYHCIIDRLVRIFWNCFCLKLCVDKLIITFDYKLFFKLTHWKREFWKIRLHTKYLTKYIVL